MSEKIIIIFFPFNVFSNSNWLDSNIGFFFMFFACYKLNLCFFLVHALVQNYNIKNAKFWI